MRRELARVATKLALFSPLGTIITKESVIAESTIPKETLDDLQNGLWSGWPAAFFRLSSTHACDDNGSRKRSFDPNFVCIRARVLKQYLKESFDSEPLHLGRPNGSSPADARTSWRAGHSTPARSIDAAIAKQSLSKQMIACSAAQEVLSSTFDDSSWTHVVRRVRKPRLSMVNRSEQDSNAEPQITSSDIDSACSCDLSQLNLAPTDTEFNFQHRYLRSRFPCRLWWYKRSARRIRRLPWRIWEGRRASRSSRLARQMPRGLGKQYHAWKRRCSKVSCSENVALWKEEADEALEDLRM